MIRSAAPSFAIALWVAGLFMAVGRAQDGKQPKVPPSAVLSPPAGTQAAPTAGSAPVNSGAAPAEGAPPAAAPSPGAQQPEFLTSITDELIGPPVPFEEMNGPEYQRVWGVVGMRFFADGERMAPNGIPYDPLFSVDLNFNLWLCPKAGVYFFGDSRFWGQKATHNVTNGDQGIWDFSKREFDFLGGVAWNYYRYLEARIYAYSLNSFNRGVDLNKPHGFKDGLGLENRYYLGSIYQALGTRRYDVTEATFISLGYLPTKELVGADGNSYKPALYGETYLVYDFWENHRAYLYGDLLLMSERPVKARTLYTDLGLAVRPLRKVWGVELRVGAETTYDFRDQLTRNLVYGAIRVVY